MDVGEALGACHLWSAMQCLQEAVFRFEQLAGSQAELGGPPAADSVEAVLQLQCPAREGDVHNVQSLGQLGTLGGGQQGPAGALGVNGAWRLGCSGERDGVGFPDQDPPSPALGAGCNFWNTSQLGVSHGHSSEIEAEGPRSLDGGGRALLSPAGCGLKQMWQLSAKEMFDDGKEALPGARAPIAGRDEVSLLPACYKSHLPTSL